MYFTLLELLKLDWSNPGPLVRSVAESRDPGVLGEGGEGGPGAKVRVGRPLTA